VKKIIHYNNNILKFKFIFIATAETANSNLSSGYGFACFAHLVAFILCLSAAFYISPLCGTKKELSMLRAPESLTSSSDNNNDAYDNSSRRNFADYANGTNSSSFRETDSASATTVNPYHSGNYNPHSHNNQPPVAQPQETYNPNYASAPPSYVETN
jgi:hypothetical protein